MAYTFALAGNQNSGKTTLFNLLTGANQHVGNWPGVTVAQKTGKLIHHHHGQSTHFGLPATNRRKNAAKSENTDVDIVDLPGIYSLSPYTMEEVVSRDFITLSKPDAVINIVDATNLERNLYLTLQLMELGTPMVIALNMMDEVRTKGDVIHVRKLEAHLGVPVIPICARKNEGTDELVRRVMEVAQKHVLPPERDFCAGALHKALHAVELLVEDAAKAKNLQKRYVATKVIEGDDKMLEMLQLDDKTMHIISELVLDMETELGMERAASIADMRYTYIESILNECVSKKNSDDSLSPSDKIDTVLTHKWLAIPTFILAMLMVFYITFGPVGAFVTDAFQSLIDWGIESLSEALISINVATWVHDLLIEGILTGVGSVLGFMPTIVILFLCLSILEDSGYMARAAFLMDKPLRKIGLNGKSFIPMMMGFGCTVPAVMASRTMNSQRDRRFTILLTPFMSCGAKVPIYALFTVAFFPNNQVLVMTGLYLLGILVAIASGFLLKGLVFHGDAAPFIMELPNYRLPTFRNVIRQMYDKAKDFVQRAFTIIFMATIVVWFLQHFTFSFEQTDSIASSMLGALAGFIAPLFTPLGFGNIEAATAIITGIMAKESVVSTLAILTDADIGSQGMLIALHGIFPTAAAALSFLTFVLLYMPCIAAYAAMKREMESAKWAIAGVAMQTGIAWLVAFLVYHITLLLL